MSPKPASRIEAASGQAWAGCLGRAAGSNSVSWLHLGFAAIDGLILLQVGLERRLEAAAILTAVFLATPLSNELINRSLASIGIEIAEAVRVAWNLGDALLVGHLTGWGMGAGAYLLLLIVGSGVLLTPSSLWRGAVLWGGTLVVAALDGGTPIRWLPLGAGTAAAFFLIRDQSKVIAQMLDEAVAGRGEIERARRELGAIHDAAVRQEKLAALGMLAAGIAHEINNPMSFVGSNVSLLHRELKALPTLPEPLREWVDEILPETLDGIRRVNSIVADLRRFARNDRAEMEPFDLNEEVEAALRIARLQVKGSCALVRDLGPVPQLLGRPRQISQMLLNLIVNAAHALHGRDRGIVTVITRRAGDEVLVAVRDNGVGMDESTRARLFEPFFTTKPVGEGTGLGLAVVHGVVADHGGRIEVESAPGAGSCFTVRLPCQPTHVPAPESRPTGTWRLDAIQIRAAGA